MAGGTLQNSAATTISGLLFADTLTTSTISNTLGAGTFTVGTQLNGSGTLLINSPTTTTIVSLSNPTVSGTYTGLIDINSGILRMGNSAGLSGGTIQVDNGTTGLFQIGAGFATGRVNVLSGGIAEADTNNTIVSNLHMVAGSTLRGGTLQVGNGGSNGSRIYLDSAGATIQTTSAGQTLTVGAQLNGSVGVNIAGSGTVQLGNDILGDTYAGTISIASGTVLRMNNLSGLSSGTVSLTSTGGTFNLGTGYQIGRVNVNAGAVAQATSGAAAQINDMHLNGGRLEMTVAASQAGNTGANSLITVDSASTIRNALAGVGNFQISSQLSGAGNLTIENTNTANAVLLAGPVLANTYSGTISIGSGFLQMGNVNGLNGGTVQLNTAAGIFNLGTGFANGRVNVDVNGVARATNGAAAQINDMHLNGGRLEMTVVNSQAGNTSVNSMITVDSASTIRNAITGAGNFQISSQLNGASNLTIENTNTANAVLLSGPVLANTYSGTISIGSGFLQMGNVNGLNGGNVLVNTAAGIFNLGSGFANGRVNVDSTGVARAMNATTARIAEMHLNGGRLEMTVASSQAGDNTGNSRIFMDSASTIRNATSGVTTFNISSQLVGSGNVTIENTNAGSTTQLNGPIFSNLYTGTVTGTSGNVRLSNSNGLGGGTLQVDTSGATYQLGVGFVAGHVNVLSSGVAINDTTNSELKDLHLMGGTLRATAAVSAGNSGANSGNRIYVDAASTIQNTGTSGIDFTINSQLIGSNTLNIAGSGRVILNSNLPGETYSGTVVIPSGSILRMGNAFGLNGGTVNVASTGGTLQLGAGAYHGTINVQTGATLTVDQNNPYLTSFHLQGGTLQGNANFNAGNSSASSGNFIYVDADSTLKGSTAAQNINIQAQLRGSNNLAIDGLGIVQLANNIANESYTGTVTINSGGTLRMSAIYGLSGGTLNLVSGGGTFQVGAGAYMGRINVQTGAAATVETNNGYLTDFHLQGGTLQGNANLNAGNSSASSGNRVYFDAASTIKSTTAAQSLFVQAQLLGTNNLAIDGPGTVQLANNIFNESYTGTVTINSGGTLRLNNAYGLSGGTLNVVSTGGTFQVGAGAQVGRINVQTGAAAIVESNNGWLTDFHLQGGTLQGNGNFNAGNSSASSGNRINVDAASTIKSTTAAQNLNVQAQLLGSNNLAIDGPGIVQLNNDIANESYTGTVTINSGGTLRLSNAYGLSGGTLNVVSTGGTFQLGAGALMGTVNVQTGATAVNDTNNSWLTHFHLQGGTLQGNATNSAGNSSAGSGNRIYVDSASTIQQATSGATLTVNAQLIGSSNLTIAAPGAGTSTVQLSNNEFGETYSGTITIASGAILRMGNNLGLNGGTVQVDTTNGIFDLSAGFYNGRVNVLTNGVARATNGSNSMMHDMHLTGGELQMTVANSQAGNNAGSGSRLTMDAATTSTIRNATSAATTFNISSQLLGSGNVTTENTHASSLVQLNGNILANSYSGTITTGSVGFLRMGNASGLNGGTINVGSAGQFFQLGAGFNSGQVNVNSGGIAQADSAANASAVNLHLAGGTLRSANASSVTGDNTTGSNITVDAGSVLDSNSQTMNIRSRLNGSGNLTKNSAGTTLLTLDNSATYTGNVTISAGQLRPVMGGLGSGINNLTIADGGAQLNTSDLTGGFANFNVLVLGTHTLTFGDVDATQTFSTTALSITDDTGASFNPSGYFTGTARTINLRTSTPTDYTFTAGTGNWTVTGNWTDGAAPTGFANYAGRVFNIASGDVAQTTTDTVFNDRLNLQSSGRLEVNNGSGTRTANNLHLAGGELRGTANNAQIVGQIFADAATSTTVNNNAGSGTNFFISSQLNGSGTLVINSGNANAITYLNNSNLATTFTGLIDIDQGILRMNNSLGLNGGTIQVDNGTTGLFQIGSGFSNGRVNVLSGGIAESTNNNAVISNLHLQAGTLRGNNHQVGNGGSGGSKIFVDSASTIESQGTSGTTFGIGAQLNGTADLSITGAGITSLNNDIPGNTYSGTITIASGSILTMGNNAGLSGGTVNVNSGGGAFRVGQGFQNGTVNVNTGGVAVNNANNVIVTNLHLAGGTLQGNSNQQIGSGGSGGSRIYVDSASTIQSTTSAQFFYLGAQLNGSADLSITGPGIVALNNDLPGNTYSGAITIASGGTLNFNHPYGLSGGTVNVNSGGGTLQLNQGFYFGRVNVNSGGVAVNTGNNTPMSNFHLAGGTLQGNSNINFGNGGSGGSRLIVDSASTIQSTTSGQFLLINAELSGSSDLNIAGPGLVYLNNNLPGNTYSGNITIASGGTLNFNHPYGLSGGTVNVNSGGGTLQLNQGFSFGRVNVNSGGVAVNTANNTHMMNLHLVGGTLQGTSNIQFGNGGSGGSRIFVDSASTIQSTIGGQNIAIGAQLNGSADLSITGPGTVSLNNDLPGNTYTGSITIASGGTLRFDHPQGLSGGTVNVNSGGGTLQLNQGFSFGRVNVNSGGVAVNTANNTHMMNLHLVGGTLQGNGSIQFGNGGSGGSRIFVDSASTIQSTTSGQHIAIGAQLNGTADLSIAGPGVVALSNDVPGNTYSGSITIASGGTLRFDNSLGLSGGTVNVNSGGGILQLNQGFQFGRVNVNSGSTAVNTANNTPMYNLHLVGGTLQGNGNINFGNGGSAGSRIFVDSASTIQSTTTGQFLQITAQLNGSGNLDITGPGQVYLSNDLVSPYTYTGTISVASGGTLIMGNNQGLSGGTVQLSNPTGAFLINEGFANGRVNVLSGGIAQANSTNSRIVSDMHLMGGTLRGTAANNVAGDGTANSKVTVDADSTLDSTGLGSGNQWFLSSRLSGAGNLNVNMNNSGAILQLQGVSLVNDYTGTITVTNGVLRMNNNEGLSGGTVLVNNANGIFRLGEGFANGRVNVTTGGVAEADNTNQRVASNLHLQGGTLRGTAANNRFGDNTNASNIYVDNDSILASTGLSSGQLWVINSRLNGSGNLTVNLNNSGAILWLEHQFLNSTYSGTITVGTGVLRMNNANGLSGGTVLVNNANGIFRLGEGFANGRVNVATNGIAEADNTASPRTASNLHLMGGTLRGTTNNARAGGNTNADNIYVDSDSILASTGLTAGQQWFMNSRLNGSANLAVNLNLSTAILQLEHQFINSTYTGTIDINTGIVRMNNANGLSGGTVQVDNGTTGLFRLGEGFNNGRVNVLSGGIAEADNTNSRIASNLHMAGGTLRGNVNNARAGDNTNASNIYVDANSELSSSGLTAGQQWFMNSRLNGSGNLAVNLNLSTAILQMEHQFLNSTYTGTIDINTGIVRMNNANGLSGGTVQVDNGTTGLFRLGTGFANGRVNVLTGGIAEADNTSAAVAADLHLMGGTLRNNTTSATIVGNNTSASRITVDAASTLASTATTGSLQLQSQIFGTGNLTVNSTAGLQVYLATNGADLQNTVSYSGNWNVLSGTLRLGNGGNGNANALLGSGATLNIASGQQVLLDDVGSNAWDIRQTLTGNGTVTRTGTTDTVFIRRNNDNTAGGVSPGNSSGILNVAAPLTFGLSSVGNYNPLLNIEVTGGGATAGTDFDRLNITGSTSTISNINVANLRVNVSNLLTQADLTGDKLAFLTNPITTGRNFSTYGQTFNSVVQENPHWSATVVYGDAPETPFGNFAVYLENFLFTSLTAYWDLNGDTTNSGSATPSGNWSTSDANWGFNSAGTTSTLAWTNGDDAVFSAGGDATGAFNVTLTSPVTAHNITVEEGTPTIQSGTLTLAGVTPTITVNSSLANISSAIAGSAGLTKAGSGTLTLSGANTYGGATDILNGTLLQNGTHTGGGTYTVAANAIFGGSGSTDSLLAGAGLVSPGNSQGIVAVDQVDPSGGLDFAFELTFAGDPLWSNSAASLNDVLRMTDATTPLTSALSAANTMDIYFSVGSLLSGDAFRGAFFTDLNNNFLTSILLGTYNYWVLGDGSGTDTTFEGQGFYSLANYNSNMFVTLSTVQIPSANFTSGTVNNGWVMQFEVQEVSAVPEPSTFALALLGLAALGCYGWRRRQGD